MRLVRFALAPTLALLALVAAACQSTSASLARMHTSYLEETAEAGLSGTLRDGYTEKQTERRARVHAMHEAGEIRTTRDRLYAAALLVSGTELADLTLA